MSDFEELYRQYYKQVYYYLLGLCGNEHVAEEITQEAFFKALNGIDGFRGECKINVWIMQIAKNTFYNDCRRKKTETEALAENIAARDETEERLIDRETAGSIHAILHKLPEPYREVFWMRTFGELSFREIGDIHEKTESWARVTYYRAKMMIREALE